MSSDGLGFYDGTVWVDMTELWSQNYVPVIDVWTEEEKMNAEDIDIISCRYCAKQRYRENKRNMCEACEISHSYRYDVVRSDYDEMFDELEDLDYNKYKDLDDIYIRNEISNRFIMDVASGKFESPEKMVEMANKILEMVNKKK